MGLFQLEIKRFVQETEKQRRQAASPVPENLHRKPISKPELG